MPAVCYLNDYDVKRFAHVHNDKDMDELLQELNKASNRLWLVEVITWIQEGGLLNRWFGKPTTKKTYTLYLDCHGEYQVMNLMTADSKSGSVFSGGASREEVMNFMVGYIAGST